MLIAVDPSLGTEATACAVALDAAFKEAVSAFVAPLDDPEPGLDATLTAVPPIVLQGATPPAWLQALPARRVTVGTPLALDAIIDSVAEAAGLTRKGSPKAHGGQVPPLAGDVLASGLADLSARWHVAATPAATSPQGLKIELVAAFRCADYAAAADFARAIAEIANEQDHHPTLIHDWRTVRVRVTTGAAQGRLTQRDLVFAAAVEARFSG